MNIDEHDYVSSHAPLPPPASSSQPVVAPVVRLRGVGKAYRLMPALRDINLNIQAGEMLAIVGPSGSGKTTLLNLIGLLDRPSSGTIEIQGVPTTTLTSRQYAQQRQSLIGFVFQTYNLIPVLDALDNVLLPLWLRGGTRAEERARAAALLDEVGLQGHYHQRPDQMSGGQRQRVAIARALIAQPRLVIADEPTASLDSVNTHAAMQLFQRLNQDHRVTFVFSTHDERALNYMSRSIRLCDGKLLDTRDLS